MPLYHFGEFRLDTLQHRLFRGDAPVALKGLPLAVLHQLLEHRLHPHASLYLSKDDLIRSVWHDTRVSPETIRSTIRQVRLALEDSSDEPRYLQTEPRLGWRVLVAVNRHDGVLPTDENTVQPPNSPYSPVFYVQRQEEATLHGSLRYPSRPMVIYGPQGIGKRTLLAHVLAESARVAPSPPCVLRIHLHTLTPAQLATMETTMYAIAQDVLEGLALPAEAARDALSRHFSLALDPPLQLKRLLREQLALAQRAVFLVLGDIELLAYSPLHAPFFDALRSWQDAAGLSSLRLFLLSALPPRLFPASVHSPWWTKTAQVEVFPLQLPQLQRMASLHGLTSSRDDCEHLRSLVGGLPLLCRIACFHARTHNLSLSDLLVPHRIPQVFESHLTEIARWLDSYPTPTPGTTWRTILHAAADPTGLSLPREIAWPLLRKGLLHEPARPEVYHLRCPLYRDHLRLGGP